MTGSDPVRRAAIRWRVVAVVALLHIAILLGLVRAFAPDFTTRVAESVVSAVTVTITSPPPPKPEPTAAPVTAEPAGAAGEAGRKAEPKAVTAPKPKVAIAVRPAPQVAGTGAAVTSGARESGSGTGASGTGSGPGSGGTGDGSGSGGSAAKAVKVAGDINSARDYPAATREQRLGDHVIVALTVGTDGRVSACRIVRASRDPEADRITCRLATERFRFRPATNAAGQPVESVYGWRQRWFDPRPRQAEPRSDPQAPPSSPATAP